MRLRYKAPAGGGTLELDDSATVGQLLDAIRSSTGFNDVTVKYGWPPKALTTDQSAESLQSLGLQRESFTVVPAESAVPTPTVPGPSSSSTSAAPTLAVPNTPAADMGAPKSVEDQSVSVKIPENGSELVLRVMPDDNSCLFTAVGGALRGLPPSPEGYTPERLRRIVVDHIRDNPTKYTRVVLDADPAAYCARMLQPDTWGGAIELGIISEVFGLEICSVDVKTNSVYRYGEGMGYPQRCILVYSNIHYDRIAESLVPGSADLDFEVVRWDVDSSDKYIDAARELCRVLREEHHYFTDTSEFVVTCNVCGWIGQGEKAVVLHSQKTGHTDISEIVDNAA